MIDQAEKNLVKAVYGNIDIYPRWSLLKVLFKTGSWFGK